MRVDSTRILPKASEVVVGLFTEIKNAKDTIYDLSRAGFDASQINVAYASDTERRADIARAHHSILWRLRDSFEQDLLHHGPLQITGETANGDAREASLCTEVDLRTALSQVGVASDRISLLEREMGAGVLLLVKAGSHREMAHEIVERNNGTIRTDTALETAPKISAEG